MVFLWNAWWYTVILLMQPRTLIGGHSQEVGSLDWKNHVFTSGGMDGKIINNDVRVWSHIVETYGWWEYMYEIPRHVRSKNREKKFTKEKIITYKIVFTWFSNLLTTPELQEFHYSQEKIQSMVVQFFPLKNDIKNLIFKTTVFISCA